MILGSNMSVEVTINVRFVATEAAESKWMLNGHTHRVDTTKNAKVAIIVRGFTAVAANFPIYVAYDHGGILR